jgi:uncharacterized protein YjbI with pentapeptide repeats
MALEDDEFLLEEYKTLRSQIVGEMTTIYNIFNYGLVTLGISFTAIQAIFNQINEVSKSSSTTNIDQLNLLTTLLWFLLILFVPFICIVFTFKWLSPFRSAAITGCWIASELESIIVIIPYRHPLSWETELRRLRNTTQDLFLRIGGWHPIIVLFFFLFIGFISQFIWWLTIESELVWSILSCVAALIYFSFVFIALQEFRIIRDILRLENFNELHNITQLFLSWWLLLLILPALIIGLLWFRWTGFINPVEITQQKIVSTYVENVNSLIDDDALSKTKRENTLSIARGLTLKTIERLDELNNQDALIDDDALSETKRENTLSIATGLTLKTIERLDELKKQDAINNGKSEIISFLYDFGLIGSTTNDGLECKTDISLDLRRVNLENVNLAHKNLQCINLKGTSLQKANLSETVLSGADLSYAILINAKFKNANLSGINLTGADLTGAILTGAYIDIEKSKVDLTPDQENSACKSTDNDDNDKCKKWVECQQNNEKICNFYYERPKQ